MKTRFNTADLQSKNNKLKGLRHSLSGRQTSIFEMLQLVQEIFF